MKTLAIWSPRPDAQLIEPISPTISLYGLPVITIHEIAFDAASLRSADGVIFVSHYAVKHALSRLIPADFSNKTVIAIGQRTARALAALGLSVDVTAPPPFTSEALLADADFQCLPCHHFVIICGRGGRQLIQQRLCESGKTVQQIACYQRDKTNLSPQVMVKFLDERAIGGMLLSSGEIAEAVAEQLTQVKRWQFFHLPAFAFSERIAQRAQLLGFTNVIVAAQASQHNLNQRIINWWEGE